MSLGHKKLLVLVVDRDDDLKRKTGISTPLIGFEENLKAAQSLALSDPEEADVNAMFGALRVYKELVEKFGKENVEIATLAGEEREGLEADTKIMHELGEVLKVFHADGVVFISDGVTDEFVLPVISSRVPVISVKRLVVRQSESVERTWLILGRYLRLAFTEPRYARIFLGVPGLLLTVVGILYLLNLVSLPLILTAIGLILIIRGFNVDQKITGIYNWLINMFRMPAYRQLRAFATLVSILLILSGLYIGYISVMTTITTIYSNPPDPSLYTWWWIEKIPLMTGLFLTGSIDIISAAILISVSSSAVYYAFIKDQKFWRTIRSIVLAIWMWAVFKRTGILIVTSILGPFEESQVFLLIIVAILGIATMAVTLIVTRYLSRIYSEYFKPRKEKTL
ncbi:MAG: DUF373 family protein [Aigarchaeota archaeon]|nr:DUF373 family protein [Aigarchaeota archaeon]MCX8193392.1 DUF373 family protein [Nitrososphaeria archaeon]MDW7985922.1 DUF373 family protein [Nitrososphaerota archaeon]